MPKKVVGWYDKNTRAYGHSEPMSEKEAKQVKSALKSDRGKDCIVIIGDRKDDDEEEDEEEDS